MHQSLQLTFVGVHVSDFLLWYSTAGTVRGHSKLRTYLWSHNKHLSLLLSFLFYTCPFFPFSVIYSFIFFYYYFNELIYLLFSVTYLSLRWFPVACGIFSTSTFNEWTYTTKLFRLMLQYKHLTGSHWWKSLSHDGLTPGKIRFFETLKNEHCCRSNKDLFFLQQHLK